jgi:transcriptional/translational regulatory protein YebC/TACO1
LATETAEVPFCVLQTAQDMKKAKLYGKIGKLIVQAAKIGGPDPMSNTKLKDVLAQAKLVDCPKEIIERNLKKASDKQQADYAEVGFTSGSFIGNLNKSQYHVSTAAQSVPN